MAAMAPALTEAATQAKIKLPETNTAASSDSVNRRNIHKQHKDLHVESSRENVKEIVKPYGTVASSPVLHLNGHSPQSMDNRQPSLLAKRQLVQVPLKSVGLQPRNKTDLTSDKSSSFQNEFLKTIGPVSRPVLGKVPQIMNQPSTRLGDEEGKCHGQIVKNRSNTPPVSDVGRSAVGNSSVAPQTGQAGLHSQVQGRSDANMCRKEGEGGRSVPNSNNTPTPSPVGGQAGRNRSLTSTSTSGQQQPIFTSSPDSSGDAERIDEDVQNARGEASKKQAQLERRIEFLLRRLRRVQARQVEKHTRGQLGSYVEHQHRNLQTVARTITNPSQANENSSDLKKELLSDGVKNLSTAALVSLVQRMQASSSLQQQPPSVKPEVTTSVLTMSEDVRKESKVAAEKLKMNLNFMQSALDSDATESSSGGESGEEDGSESLQPSLPTTPLVRRAEWKWAYERAAVASRWTWLQAQVSDLEYRIRQQTDIYRQARQSKGQVVLGEPPAPQDLLRASSQTVTAAASVSGEVKSGAAVLAAVATGTEVSPLPVSALLSNVDKQASRLTQSLGNCLSPANTSPASSVSSSRPKSGLSSPAAAPNGLIDSPLSTASVDVEGCSPQGVSTESRVTTESLDLSPVLDPTCRAARCLPLKYPLRKRKLLRTSGLHLKSPKAARLSSVKCHCHPPVTPCVLCSGRVNSVQTVDPSYMPNQERVALLDHSYHQVLSFPEEVPLSVHFEALLRSGDWQNKSSVRRPRAEQSQRRQKLIPNLTDGRKKPFRKNAASVIIQSAKIRNKYEQKAGRKPGPQPGKHMGKRALNNDVKRRRSNAAFGAEAKRRSLKGSSEFPGSSADTPAASPLSRDAILNCSNQKEKEVRKRRGESAYDINNIVIPHSMASLTRVEKLEYKEIPIPSWRDVTKPDIMDVEEDKTADVHEHKSNGLIAASKTPEDEEVEDLSDEAFIQRHKRCEQEERKHFSSFVRFPPTRRHRAHGKVTAQPIDGSQTEPSRPSTPNRPVSMGTQASLDGGDFGWDDSMDVPGPRPSSSLPQTPRSSTPVLPMVSPEEDSSGLGSSGLNLLGASLPRRSSVSASQRERLSLGSSMEEGDWDRVPVIKPWPPRQFPLSEEEVIKLTVEEPLQRDVKPQRSLRAVSGITTLRPQPVDGVSQAGSSVSGSLPPSPMPSTSSASAAGDYDAADPEWVAEERKTANQQKLVKR